MYLTFNELCVNDDISMINNDLDGKICIDNFVDFLHLLKTNNILAGISTVEHFSTFQLFSKYGFSDWFKDPNVKRERKQFLRSTWDKLSLYIDKNDFDSEFSITLDGIEYSGVGLVHAMETEGMVLSILTNCIFQTDLINGMFRSINYDTGDFTEINVSVNNLNCKSNLKVIKQNLENELFENISSGQDLWEQRKNLFPNLVFCKSVKEQLYKDPEKQHIISIMKRLLILQKYFERSIGYNCKDIGYDARSESDTVKADPILKAMRRFLKPDGSYAYFFDHISFTGKFSGGRIYFLPDNAEKLCYIGYIGRHLPTKKY